MERTDGHWVYAAIGVPAAWPSPIGFLQGAAGPVIQNIMRDFGRALLRRGIAVAGMVEAEGTDFDSSPDLSAIEDLATGRRFNLYQDLGTGSQSCSLDSIGLSDAAGALESALGQSCALVIISKFGKEEAAGRGFSAAFQKAVLLGVPVLTSVNPMFDADWQDFSGGMAVRISPGASALEHWWADRAAASQCDIG